MTSRSFHSYCNLLFLLASFLFFFFGTAGVFVDSPRLRKVFVEERDMVNQRLNDGGSEEYNNLNLLVPHYSINEAMWHL